MNLTPISLVNIRTAKCLTRKKSRSWLKLKSQKWRETLAIVAKKAKKINHKKRKRCYSLLISFSCSHYRHNCKVGGESDDGDSDSDHIGTR